MILFIFIVIILFFPLKISIFTYFNSKVNKTFFAIYLFKFIKILSGYIKVNSNGKVFLHLKNRAILLRPQMFIDLTYDLDIRNFIIIKSLNLSFDVSADKFTPMFLSLSLIYLNKIFSNVLINNNFHQKLYTELNLYEDKSGILAFRGSFLFAFNIFCILIYIIANLIIKGVLYVKKRIKIRKFN